MTSLMTDTAKRFIRDDVLGEKVPSAIVEAKAGLDRVPAILRTVRGVSRRLEPVGAVGVSTR